MRLIVTRPEPGAARTAKALRALGHEPILSPALTIRFLPMAVLPQTLPQAVVVTSANAVRAIAAHPGLHALKDLPLLAVGDETALAARRAGFNHARSAGGGVTDLAKLAAAVLDADAGALLYLAGDVQSGDLPGLLKEQGFAVETVVIYRAKQEGKLAPAALDALREGSADGILVYSRRSAEAFAAAVRSAGLAPLRSGVRFFAISDQAAEPLQTIGDAPVSIAAEPDQLRLFALLERR